MPPVPSWLGWGGGGRRGRHHAGWAGLPTPRGPNAQGQPDPLPTFGILLTRLCSLATVRPNTWNVNYTTVADCGVGFLCPASFPPSPCSPPPHPYRASKDVVLLPLHVLISHPRDLRRLPSPQPSRTRCITSPIAPQRPRSAQSVAGRAQNICFPLGSRLVNTAKVRFITVCPPWRSDPPAWKGLAVTYRRGLGNIPFFPGL
jgi:hypothetical protein